MIRRLVFKPKLIKVAKNDEKIRVFINKKGDCK
jgi:hypothetical protein